MSDAPISFVFFDIDGTLVHTHNAGKRAFARAIQATFDWADDLSHVDFAGNTDLKVLRGIARKWDHELTEEEIDRFFGRLPIELEQTADASTSVLFPGVRELLEALAAAPHVRVGLVTGNIEACARIKLDLFDLRRHFLLGAFGDDDADRVEIARRAIDRARASLASHEILGPCYLVGDTPSDIEAARAIGAVSLALATGGHEQDVLTEQGADYVLADLSNLEEVLSLLGIERCGDAAT